MDWAPFKADPADGCAAVDRRVPGAWPGLIVGRRMGAQPCGANMAHLIDSCLLAWGQALAV